MSESARGRAGSVHANSAPRTPSATDDGGIGLVAGIVGGVVVAALIVTVVLITSVRPQTRGPQNMQSDGRQDRRRLHRHPHSRPADRRGTYRLRAEPVGCRRHPDLLRLPLPQLRRLRGAQRRTAAGTGSRATPPRSNTTRSRSSPRSRTARSYSLRAANAAACVAELSPDEFFAFHEALFVDQPEENTDAYSDDDLVANRRRRRRHEHRQRREVHRPAALPHVGE